MGFKKAAIVIVGVVGLASAATGITSSMMDANSKGPAYLPEFEQEQREQQLNDLVDSQDRTTQKHEDDAEDLSNSEKARQSGSNEHRPGKPNLPGWWW